ncbi:MAG TPA: PAS domain-containing protein [Spirochaetales bacterium]|nr:PAS domain-containing protein [Spirochaetales bacterium]
MSSVRTQDTSTKLCIDARRAAGSYKFTDKDRRILARYEIVVDAIARAFGHSCEVVLHSLEDISHSVIKIVNGDITGRVSGSPITDFGLEILRKSVETQEDIIGAYFSEARSGKPLRSVTMLIRNDGGQLIGFMCINFDLSVSLYRFAEEMASSFEVSSAGENFAPDVSNLVEKAVSDELDAIARTTGISSTEKNRQIVLNLEKKKIFEIKGAVELVGNKLGVTKHTIYKYLREFRVH